MPADFLETWPAIWDARQTFSPAAFGTALGTIVLILVIRRAAPKFPGLIFAVGLASLVALVADFRVDTIADRFGSLPSHLPTPT